MCVIPTEVPEEFNFPISLTSTGVRIIVATNNSPSRTEAPQVTSSHAIVDLFGTANIYTYLIILGS